MLEASFLMTCWQIATEQLKLWLNLWFSFKTVLILNLYLYRRNHFLVSIWQTGCHLHFYCFFLYIWVVQISELWVERLTVGRTCTPPSPLWRGSLSKDASCVCLPAEELRCCRSFWVRSYLSSWLASSVRSRNQGEHMRMSFVIKAGNRLLNLSWGMQTVTVTACVTLWSLSFISSVPQIDTRQERRQNRIRHTIIQVEFIWEHDGGVKFVII